jgi:hypothetical protein
LDILSRFMRRGKHIVGPILCHYRSHVGTLG